MDIYEQNLEAEIKRLGKKANDLTYDLALLQAENKRLKKAFMYPLTSKDFLGRAGDFWPAGYPQ